MNRPGRLLAGQVGKPHGLRGEVYVLPISDDPQRFAPGAVLVHADGRSLTIQDSRSHGERLLVKFVGADTRSDAAGLRGALYVAASLLRELGDDEFWPHDLAGCDVVLTSGDVIGKVVRVDPSPGQDLIVVDTAAGERLVPAVKAIVVDIDVDARRVTIDPPEGLLD